MKLTPEQIDHLANEVCEAIMKRKPDTFWQRVCWRLGIGWKCVGCYTWLHSFSRIYINKKTGERRDYHEPC